MLVFEHTETEHFAIDSLRPSSKRLIATFDPDSEEWELDDWEASRVLVLIDTYAELSDFEVHESDFKMGNMPIPGLQAAFENIFHDLPMDVKVGTLGYTRKEILDLYKDLLTEFREKEEHSAIASYLDLVSESGMLEQLKNDEPMASEDWNNYLDSLDYCYEFTRNWEGPSLS